VRLPFSRTRAKLIYHAKGFIFDKAGFQKVIDLREKHQLEDAMGFRGQFDEHRRFQIEMLKKQGLRPEHSLLELGCGPLTAAIPLIDYLDRSKYVGVDIRSSVLDMGWKEIGRAGLSAKNARLVCSSDFGSETIGGQQFDFVFSFSVLYHLSDDILGAYFSTVAKQLKLTGACIANVNTDIPSDKWLEFPFIKRTVDDYAAVAKKWGLATKNLGQIKDLGFRNSAMEMHNPLLRFEML
jgi:SAM-dependent methyltransferase